jgi:integrase
LETGARWSELTRAEWSDVDLEQRTLVLRAANTKTGRTRVIPLRRGLTDVLAKLRSLHEEMHGHPIEPDGRVFLTSQGARWSRSTNNAMRILNRVLVRAGIVRENHLGQLDIHALRHTFASRLARTGAGLVQAQRLLGHADPKLTARVYTHLGVEDLRDAVEGIEQTHESDTRATA